MRSIDRRDVVGGTLSALSASAGAPSLLPEPTTLHSSPIPASHMKAGLTLPHGPMSKVGSPGVSKS